VAAVVGIGARVDCSAPLVGAGGAVAWEAIVVVPEGARVGAAFGVDAPAQPTTINTNRTETIRILRMVYENLLYKRWPDR
jgi:hypothetical protein